MIISPVMFDLDSPVQYYRSGPVYTVINGIKTFVGENYVGWTRQEVIRQALLNIKVKLDKSALIDKMSIS